MVNISGGLAGSIDSLKEALEKKTSVGNLWVKSIPKETGIEVRFLTEPDEWYAYGEHYADGAGYFPCIGEGCPGCSSKDQKAKRKSRRWLASAVDTSSGFVVPIKLPLDVVNRLIQRYERNGGTITNRNYLLMRYGVGLDTTYDVEAQDKEDFPFEMHEQLDLYEVLAEQFADAFGDADDSAESKPLDDAPVLNLGKKKAKVAKPEPEPVVEEDSDDSDDEEDEYLTEADLLKMTRDELVVIGNNLGAKVTTSMKKDEMVETIIAAAE